MLSRLLGFPNSCFKCLNVSDGKIKFIKNISKFSMGENLGLSKDAILVKTISRSEISSKASRALDPP